jgi:predicted metalloprotease with PDZ domain
LGLLVKADGTVQDAIPGMPAYRSGLSPYTRIVGVNQRQFSLDELNTAIAGSKSQSGPLVLLVSNTGVFESHEIAYHGGLRYPHLIRSESEADYLTEILKPRTTPSR